MARREARISVEIWDDLEFIALSPLAQRMFIFLFSQRDMNYLGLLPLRERRWASRSAGLTVDAVRAALEELEAARFVVIDDDTEELLVRSFMRRDEVYRQPQLIRSARDALPMVVSLRIRAALAEELERIASLDGLHAASQEAIEDMRRSIEETARRVRSASVDPARTLGAPSNDHGEDLREKEDRYLLDLSSPSSDLLAPSSSKAPSEPSRRASRVAKTKRGTRIPDDFTVTPAMVQWAREKVPHVDGRLETEKFINYWRAKSGKDATKVDWEATWRNWMLNAAERRTRASPGQNVYRNPIDQDEYDDWKAR